MKKVAENATTELQAVESSGIRAKEKPARFETPGFG